MHIAALEHRQLASIVGGTRTSDGRVVARHRYRLGTAPAPDGAGYIVTMIGKLDGIAMTFEARDFENAFERAIDIRARHGGSRGSSERRSRGFGRGIRYDGDIGLGEE